MGRYVVEADELANKFGLLKKGEKFYASEEDETVKALLKEGKVKLFGDEPVSDEKVSDEPEQEAVEEISEVKKKRK